MDAHGSIDDELGAALAAQAAAEAFRPLRVLKESEREVTELVIPSDAACGPDGSPVAASLYVRKRIRLDAGAGTAYERLFAAQQAGAALTHTPRIEVCARFGHELTVVMEYVSGPTLEEHVATHGAGERCVRELAGPLCDAVSELHERFDPPLIHRDLKPSNIIISDGRGRREAGQPVIIDFGIARTWRPGAEADTARLGTRGYAAPEQFGFGQTDERSDVYALGMLLFFCCTGEQPCAGLDAAALATAGVPEGLAAVILHATAFDPAARYRSAVELKAALEGGTDPQAGTAALTVPANFSARAGSIAHGSDAAANAADADRIAQGFADAPAPNPFRQFSNALGRAWNALVVMIWSFLMIILLVCMGDSLGEGGEYPLWFAACLFGGFCGAGVSAVAWLLYDKRRLRKRYFEPWGLSRKHEWLVFIALAAVAAASFIFLLAVEALRETPFV